MNIEEAKYTGHLNIDWRDGIKIAEEHVKLIEKEYFNLFLTSDDLDQNWLTEEKIDEILSEERSDDVLEGVPYLEERMFGEEEIYSNLDGISLGYWRKEEDNKKEEELIMEDFNGTFDVKKIGTGYVTTVEIDGIVKSEVNEESPLYILEDLIRGVLDEILENEYEEDRIAELEAEIEMLKNK